MNRRAFIRFHARGCYSRIFGYGLSFDIDSKPMFSERNGLKRVLRIGRFAVKTLQPDSL